MLRRTLHRRDVLLVEGNQRVSEVIKFRTQSSWSHAALYLRTPTEGLPEGLVETAKEEIPFGVSHPLLRIHPETGKPRSTCMTAARGTIPSTTCAPARSSTATRPRLSCSLYPNQALIERLR